MGPNQKSATNLAAKLTPKSPLELEWVLFSTPFGLSNSLVDSVDLIDKP
jgi:hypothetical protein